ncbi:hypothetical protein [Sinorhizobium fredii]|uniref:hypothetical protein n=1 Tax=Rhizobium fredii TaxID=380 RepID=UPI0013E8A073|nr:hypothetical protein [Sinorhizobium fredii]
MRTLISLVVKLQPIEENRENHYRKTCEAIAACLLRDSLNRNRFKDKIIQRFKVLQRP